MGLGGDLPQHLWVGRGSFTGPMTGKLNVVSWYNNSETTGAYNKFAGYNLGNIRVMAISYRQRQGTDTVFTVRWSDISSGKSAVTVDVHSEVSIADAGGGDWISGSSITNPERDADTYPWLVFDADGNMTDIQISVLYTVLDHVNTNTADD